MTLTQTVPAPPVIGRAEQRRNRRAERYDLRRVLRKVSSLERVRKCGRVASSELGVYVKISGQGDAARAGYGGLCTCGSVHACPVDSAKIGAVRQADVEQAIKTWHERGGRVAMMTTTMRHHRKQRLSTLWSALSDAWHAVASGSKWQAEQRLHGTPMGRVVKSGKRAGQTVEEMRIPIIRVVEVTHGKRGWHVHIHALLFLRGDVTQEDCHAIGDRAYDRWRASLVGSGMRAPLLVARDGKRVAVKCQRLDGDSAASNMADYFAKANYAGSHELTGANQKVARSEAGRTPFGILKEVAALVEDGVAPEDGVDLLALWREWELASRGKQQMTWTQGFREHLGMATEKSDQEIVDEDRGGHTLAVIPQDVKNEIVRRREEHVPLDLAERDGSGDLLYEYLAGISEVVARYQFRERRRE